jgi:ACS family D-galactonate transporter-like MFS transporter
LLGLRLALGVAEAPCFPANSRVVATWFPQSERAFATGVYTVGEYIGLAFLSPLLFWLLVHHGWRSLFIVCGLIGFVFVLVWIARYRRPARARARQRRRTGTDCGRRWPGRQRQQDREDRLEQSRQAPRFPSDVGICLGQFAGNSTLVFFLTWFPTYLATERHMAFLKIGFYAVLPFIAASVGVLFGGCVVGHDAAAGQVGQCRAQGADHHRPVLASTIIAANFVESNGAVIAILSLAFFAQGMAALGWTLVSDIAPRGMLGLTGGVFNLAANLAGIVTPLVIGAIVSATGSFFYALAYVGSLALMGALALDLRACDVKRIEL